MPWYYIILNVYLYIQTMIMIILSPSLKPLLAARKELGLNTKMPVFKGYQPDLAYIIPGLQELDYPYVIPKNVTCCGPIVRRFPSVDESDPKLAKWLTNGPTVLINLVSHVQSDTEDATRIASGIQTVLERYASVQILWKLRYDGDSPSGDLLLIIGK